MTDNKRVLITDTQAREVTADTQRLQALAEKQLEEWKDNLKEEVRVHQHALGFTDTQRFNLCFAIEGITINFTAREPATEDTSERIVQCLEFPDEVYAFFQRADLPGKILPHALTGGHLVPDVSPVGDGHVLSVPRGV